MVHQQPSHRNRHCLNRTHDSPAALSLVQALPQSHTWLTSSPLTDAGTASIAHMAHQQPSHRNRHCLNHTHCSPTALLLIQALPQSHTWHTSNPFTETDTASIAHMAHQQPSHRNRHCLNRTHGSPATLSLGQTLPQLHTWLTSNPLTDAGAVSAMSASMRRGEACPQLRKGSFDLERGHMD
eukprot:1157377-Pelagomonas_calceolata.AAC.6